MSLTQTDSTPQAKHPGQQSLLTHLGSPVPAAPQPATEDAVLQFPGGSLVFRVFKNEHSPRIASEILTGKTYPHVHFVVDVRTVVDIGANIGASAVFFALTYPHARVLAFEPASASYSLLARNVAQLPNVSAFPCGLYSQDKTVALYPGINDCVESSVCPSHRTSPHAEQIQLRSAERFMADQHIDSIDVLKIDTEGCEIHILRSLQRFLPTVKLLYVEYHSDRDRRLIDSLVADTHSLWRGHVPLLHRGEFCYLNKQLIPSAGETYSAEILLPLE
jgi:FkbM family methyltransferase